MKKYVLLLTLFLAVAPFCIAASLQPYLINPATNIEIYQNEFFNFSTGVRCTEGYCGNVTVTLDPITEKSISEPIKDVPKVEQSLIERLQKENSVNVIVLLEEDNQTAERAVLRDKTASLSKIKRQAMNQQNNVLSKLEAEPEFDLKYRYSTINGFSGKITKKTLERLKQDPDVKAIYEDKILHISLQESVPLINGDDAWNLDITGNGSVVCVLDSGIDYNHPDLGGCFGPGCKVIDGYDFIHQDTDPMDDQIHGTHVAGIIAANGIVKGVAPNAKLLAVKVCNSTGKCLYSNIIAGIDWCNNHSDEYNIVAITMSIGDEGQYNKYNCPTTMDYPMGIAHNLGMFISAASGNDAYSNGISYPACSPYAVSVGSTTKSDIISDFTSTGELLDVLAPGSDIYSTLPGNSHGYNSGTSMAAPHIAGAVALLKQHAPLSSPDEIEDALKKTGVPIIDPDNGMEFPRVDILGAVEELTVKGAIPMNNGTPFYTLNQNPAICYDMKEGDSCNNTWTVNATGNIFKYHFFTKYTSNIGNITENITPSVDVRIAPVCIDNDGDGFNQSNFGCGIADCDDNNTSMHPLTNNIEIKQNTTLCPGHYNLPNGPIINASNVVLDCNGAVLDGSDVYQSRGIYVSGNNVIIKNCEIARYYYYGLFLENSINSLVEDNYIYSSGVYNALELSYANNNTLIGNNISNNRGNGVELYYSDKNSIIDNIVNSNQNHGIYVLESESNLIKDNAIIGNLDGIHLKYDESQFNTVINNNASFNRDNGIYVDGSYTSIINNSVCHNYNNGIYLYSEYNNLSGNRMCNNTGYNLHISRVTNNIDTSNTVDGKSVYYLTGQNDTVIPEDAGYVALINCRNITVANIELKKQYYGLRIYNTKNSTIRNVTVSDSNFGIYMDYSNHNIMEDVKVFNNINTGITIYHSDQNDIKNIKLFSNERYGIFVYYSDSINIKNSDVTYSEEYGIYLYYSDGNSIENVSISNNLYGIYSYYSHGNTISNSNINSNKNDGIYLYSLSKSGCNLLENNSIYSNGEYGLNMLSYHINMSGNSMESNKVNLNVIKWSYDNQIDCSNTVEGKPVYYLEGQNDTVIPEDAGYIALINCRNITVANIELEKDYYGVLIYKTQNSTIENVTVFDSEHGITIDSSVGNKIFHNTLSGNVAGIYFEGDGLQNNLIENNNILGNTYNLKNYQSHSNISVENNWWGCTDETCVKSGIYNYYSEYVDVDYDPWLYGPFGENQFPVVNNLECQSSGLWKECNILKYNDTLTNVRVNCTDRDGFITNASFSLENDSFGQVFTGNGVFSDGYYVFNNPDLYTDYNFLRLSATCIDNSLGENTKSISWIPRKGLPRSMLFYEGFESLDSIKEKNGTLYSNPTIVKGVIGNGIDFTGSKKACYPIPGNFNETNGTIEFWVKVPLGDGFGFFDIGGLMYPNSWGIFKNLNYLIMEVKNKNNWFDQAWSPNSWPYDGEWHFAAAVWERNKNYTKFKVFLDGIGKTSYDGGIPDTFPNMTQEFCIGWCKWHEYGYSQSPMDEVKIYNYVKSDEEIMQDYLLTANYSSENRTRKECIMYKPESKAHVKINCSGLYVNNESFTVKGVGYQPIPIGKTAESLQDKQEMYNNQNITKRDFKLLRKMNANTIRTWGEVMNKTFLDAAWNNGTNPIYVIMGFWINCGENYGSSTIRQEYIDKFTDYINEYKDHPAVLAWGLGNENNLGYCSDSAYIDDFYSLCNELAGVAYEIEVENYHPVGVINGDIFNIGLEYYKADDFSMNYTDFWGSNIYPGKTFGSKFEDYAAMSGKPLLVTEYGIDALNNSDYKEYEDVHAEWVLRQWKEINASNITIGSTLMAYSDEWWKAGSPSYHGYGGYYTPNHPDGYSNEEWWGVMRTVKNESGGIDIMQPRKVYYALREAFEEGNYSVGQVVDGSKIEHRFYYNNHHFMTVIGDGGTFNIRPHPGVDVDGWGSSWYMQPFLLGAVLKHTTIESITHDIDGIEVKALGYVSRGAANRYGTWNITIKFSYDPALKEVNGNGTYSIALDGGLSVATGDLNIFKIASNYLDDVPLLTGGIGDTGDMQYANVTGDYFNFVWNPVEKSSHFPQDETDYLSIDVSGQLNEVDTAAQGYVSIEPAYKPSLKVVLTSHQTGIPMIFGGIYDLGKSQDFWEDNIGITPLILQPTGIINYNFDVEFNSKALPGDPVNFYSVNVTKGWNLISIPCIIANKSVKHIFKSIDYSKLFYYNSGWKVPDKINNTMGFWIKADSDDSSDFKGLIPLNKSINLNPGWNLIGYPSLNETNISEMFDNVTIYMYNNSNWYSYITDKPSNTLTKFVPGYGYWVKNEE